MKSRMMFTSASEPQYFWLVFGNGFRQPGAGRVDEHEVGGVDQAFGVVDERMFGQLLPNSGSGVATRVGANEPSRSQIDDGLAAVIDERDGARLAVRARRGVRDIRHRRFRVAVRVLRGQVAGGGRG